MILKPIQSKNISIIVDNGSSTICGICESIEVNLQKSILPISLLYNGWKFAQKNPGAASSSKIAEFLDLILLEEIRNSFWCSNCASLVFTRIYASIVKNNIINIGFSILPGESTINNIELLLLENFELSLLSNTTSKFFVYDNVVSEYNIVRISSNEAIISNTSGRVGTISFNQISKKLIVNFDNKVDTKANKIVSYAISLNLSDIVLTTTNIKDYNIMRANIKFNNNTEEKYTGCYIAVFNDK